ncbi:bifunctional diguanylate cyclase/phosphodiesterase [Actinoplanes sp. TFC3]|uniref:putative bifunctional diguanylate cyclase/phosphodiesterase n=1 Tax=Actinoplanes sp. TFC3 TaxID=1710355 RepID=UPI000830D440|nr:EAL domain-containing protein [Actinoplanes sp. TFC3]
MIDDHEAEYWARQIRVGALIAAVVTLSGAARVALDWSAVDQRWLVPLLVVTLTQAAAALLPWPRWVRWGRTRKFLVLWWVAELPVLYLFARHDSEGMMLYLPGATLIVVLAAALFSPWVVVVLGGLSISGFLALLPYQGHIEAVAVIGMVSIMGGVVVVNGIIAYNRDKLDARRRAAERRIEALLEHSSDLVLALAEPGQIQYASPSVAAVLGCDSAEVTGDVINSMLHPDDLGEVLSWMQELRAGATGESIRRELRVRQNDGSYLYFDAVATNRLRDPDLGAIIVSLRDISVRQALEEQLSRQAFADPLTGLANRARFAERLAAAVTTSDERPATVLLIDLDGFKTVNDELGHNAGDQLLTEVAGRLHRWTRAGDTPARLGGDEFAVILQDTTPAEAAALTDRLLEHLRRPVRLHNREFPLTASIGMAGAGPGAPVSAEHLLRNADLAMYAAKRDGGDRCSLFDPAMYTTLLQEAQQRADMAQALVDEQFVVFYQPVVDLDTGALTGFEALVRWRHPRLGLLAPGNFIHHAEASGHIVPLGRWVLREACEQLARWQRGFPAARDLKMNVNLSGRQFQDAALVADVTAAIADAGIEASALTLEITESMLMDSIDTAADILGALRRLGVCLAIDDFGTGYSSLAYLQRLPVDIVKIDRSFVENVDTDPDNVALVEAVLNLARALRLQTVAEGIESVAQQTTLQVMGVRSGQGYLFGKPRDAVEISRLLDTDCASEPSVPVGVALPARP